MSMKKDALAGKSAKKNYLRTCFRGFLMVEPIIPFLFLMSFPVFAEVFGGDAQTLGRGFAEFVIYMRRWIYVLGVFAILWGLANFSMGKPFVTRLIGGAACFFAPSIIATIYEFSQGRRVDYDNPFNGN